MTTSVSHQTRRRRRRRRRRKPPQILLRVLLVLLLTLERRSRWGANGDDAREEDTISSTVHHLSAKGQHVRHFSLKHRKIDLEFRKEKEEGGKEGWSGKRIKRRCEFRHSETQSLLSAGSAFPYSFGSARASARQGQGSFPSGPFGPHAPPVLEVRPGPARLCPNDAVRPATAPFKAVLLSRLQSMVPHFQS